MVANKLLTQQQVCLVSRSVWRGGGGDGERGWWVREAGLVPAGWGWETSAILNDITRIGSTKQDVLITYFLEWTEWKIPWSDCFHTLRVPTDPLQVITASKSQGNVFYAKSSLKDLRAEVKAKYMDEDKWYMTVAQIFVIYNSMINFAFHIKQIFIKTFTVLCTVNFQIVVQLFFIQPLRPKLSPKKYTAQKN